MTLARVPWIGSRQWGRDGSDAHATSRNTQIREPSEAELTPAEAFRSRPHENELQDDAHPVSFATDPGKGVLDWYNTVGTHSHVAHATSRNTQVREPSEAELLQPRPSGVDPTKMDSTITGCYQFEVSGLSQLHQPITQGRGVITTWAAIIWSD